MKINKDLQKLIKESEKRSSVYYEDIIDAICTEEILDDEEIEEILDLFSDRGVTILDDNDLPIVRGEEAFGPQRKKADEHTLADAPIDDSIQLYMKYVGKVPLLTHEEEIALAKKIEQDNEESKQRLIEANLRLVVSI
ncbi:MAG: sigma-70 factor domain-containing protein, partial [bacterium]